MVNRIISSLLRRARSIIRTFVLEINFLSHNKKLPDVVTVHYFELVKHSGIFNANKLDQYKILKAWDATDELWNKGFYFIAVERRTELLQEVYEYHEVNYPGYFPPAVSMGFTGPIGHVGVLGAHQRAQEIGIIPRGQRVVPILNEKAKRPVTQAIFNKYQPMYFQDGAAWGEFPANWHVSERLQMVRGQSKFLDLYELLETTYVQKTVNQADPIIHLGEEYLWRASKQLRDLGLPENAWFVGLHIRNEGPSHLRRNQPDSSFKDAVDLVASMGGWVIRIGDLTMSRFPPTKNLVDLSQIPGSEFLHSYVLAKAKFLIGTTSGPTWVAPLFGTPVLVTNTTSIARNTHTMSENTFFLPKHIQSEKREWTFEEILHHTEGYAEDEFKPGDRNYSFKSNSALEIKNAVQEMFLKLEGIQNPNKKEFSDRITQIRSQANAVGQGELSYTFIENLEINYLD
jgi:putative glycosyltransferase (TIGR04372 family)